MDIACKLHMQLAKKSIITGALVLGVGAFIAKALGAVYRIPLTNLLGSEGLGLYQMVFPIYTLLLDFSGTGVPSAISKLIANESPLNRENKAKQYLLSSLRLLFYFGLIFTILMAVFSKVIASLQGNVNAYLGYVFLAPSIFLVALISCFRGYFQGLMDMKPTAISQIIEQVFKLSLGLVLVSVFLPNVKYAVAGATLAITFSELIALLYLFLHYKKNFSTFNISEFNPKKLYKPIIKTTIPITLTGIMIPLSHVIDSFVIVNILSLYTNDATGLYGIFSGACHTIINLPVSICYAIAMVAIPSVASSRCECDKRKNATKSILYTLGISVPASIVSFLFAPTIIRLLFGGLTLTEREIAIKLLKILSVNIILLSLAQTTNAVLIGKGRIYVPVFSLLVGTILKTIMNIIVLKNQSISIFGAGISLIACYFLVCLINLIVVFTKRDKHADTSDKLIEPSNQK